MAAGKYRNRIALKRPIVTQSATGDPVTAYQVIGHDYAAYVPSSGREYVASVAAQAELTARFTLRYRSDIRPDWLISYGGNDYEIRHIEDIGGRQREINIHTVYRYE